MFFICHKTASFTVTAVKASNLTLKNLLETSWISGCLPTSLYFENILYSDICCRPLNYIIYSAISLITPCNTSASRSVHHFVSLLLGAMLQFVMGYRCRNEGWAQAAKKTAPAINSHHISAEDLHLNFVNV
jgi:hypothetical protein